MEPLIKYALGVAMAVTKIVAETNRFVTFMGLLFKTVPIGFSLPIKNRGGAAAPPSVYLASSCVSFAIIVLEPIPQVILNTYLNLA